MTTIIALIGGILDTIDTYGYNKANKYKLTYNILEGLGILFLIALIDTTTIGITYLLIK